MSGIGGVDYWEASLEIMRPLLATTLGTSNGDQTMPDQLNALSFILDGRSWGSEGNSGPSKGETFE
jgi:hypothetical protein